MASDCGDEALVRRLVVQGARPTSLNDYVRQDNLILLRELLDRGPAHLSGELLKDAVSEGSRDVVRMCLQKGPALTDGVGQHGGGR